MPSCQPHTLAYHSFTDIEVNEIRSHLLAWYRANRRRLPWRGDAPPYGAAAKQQQQSQPHNSSSISSAPSTSAGTLSRYFTTLPLTSTANKRQKATPPLSQPATVAPMATARMPADAYGVWVSEVMLQQTRVEAVIDYYTRWMLRFPTVATLATASADDVNTAWSGLGYYRRARLLHEAAKHVQSTLQGRLPDSVDGLLAIPGIGPYTAGAIASIAFNKPVPLVDGNVSRVLSRLRALNKSPKHPTALALHWQLARQLAAGSGSRSGQSTEASDWSQALMELGAVVCMPRVAECGECPVRRWCRAAEEVAERRRPVGENRGTTARKRVEVEVETEEKEVEHQHRATQVEEVLDMRRDIQSINGTLTSNRRGKSGRVLQQSSNKKAKAIELDDSLCHICDPQLAAPTTVLEYPSKAQKRPPTDQHVSVCVVSRKRVSGGESGGMEWLLVQRPADGLLAGQWEFPSVVHPSPPSSSSTSPRAPTAAQRRLLLTDGLASLLPAAVVALVASSAVESVGELTHVFSHRRHLMHVQRCLVGKERVDTAAVEGESRGGRRWRWMAESDITAIGLTSGQRKIWALSRGAKVKVIAKNHTRPERRKRKGSREDEQQPSSDADDGVDENADGDDASEVEQETVEEWEVWPTTGTADEDVVETDGVIVID